MTLLVFGLLLWSAGHFFKRSLPGIRQGMGNAGKGAAAILIFGGLLALIFGYRAAPFLPIWEPAEWTRHANNLLMLIAVFLFGLGSSKSPLRSKLRHPMLLGTIVWAVAHLMVNGDAASLILFGGIGVWALAEIRVINTNVPDYTPYEGGSTAGTIRLCVITLVVFAVIAAIHTWLGYPVFPI